MGPRSRCRNEDAPSPQPFQFPLPPAPKDEDLPDFKHVRSTIASMLTRSSDAAPPDQRADGSSSYAAQFVHLAWQCAATFRATDFLGGCNGARIRFSPQREWPENKATPSILAVLDDVKQVHPSVSWADLIVLAGTVALENSSVRVVRMMNDLEFCGGRTDASDGTGSPSFLATRKTPDPLLAANDDALVKGLSLREYVALQALPRSRVVMDKLGYSGTWSHPSELDISSMDASNEYFVRLLTMDWVPRVNDQGVKEYVAALDQPGEADAHIFMTEKDLAIKIDPLMHQIALEYASHQDLFVSELASAWNAMMMADRFDRPSEKACRWR